MSGNALPSLALLPAHGPAAASTGISVDQAKAKIASFKEKAKAQGRDVEALVQTLTAKAFDIVKLATVMVTLGIHNKEVEKRLEALVRAVSTSLKMDPEKINANVAQVKGILARYRAKSKKAEGTRASLTGGVVSTGDCYTDENGKQVQKPSKLCIAFEILLDIMWCMFVTGRCDGEGISM